MSHYSKISVDEYLIDGYEIAIDGYLETLIQWIANNSINRYVHVECQIVNIRRHRTDIHEVDTL